MHKTMGKSSSVNQALLVDYYVRMVIDYPEILYSLQYVATEFEN